MPIRRVVAHAVGGGRPGPRGPAARADRVRRRVAGQSGRPRAQPAAARRREAHHRVPAGSARRRAGRHEPRRSRWPSTPRAGVEPARAGLPGHSLLRLGQPRAGRDGRLDSQPPTSARPQPLPTTASQAKVTASPAGHNPSAVNDQSEPRSSRDATSAVLPLVAGEGQHGVGRIRVRGADRRLRGRGLLVRRHGQRRVPHARLVARPLQGRRGVEAGGSGRARTASRRTATTRSRSSP